jgi:hypothetical protein
MTIEELLNASINTLEGIKVPVSLTDEVAMPIRNVAFALRGLHDAISKRDAKVQEEEIKENNENVIRNNDAMEKQLKGANN